MQGILPPQPRPNLRLLREVGFQGSDEQVIRQAAHAAPQLLSAFSSASSMWTANAATVSPSADSADGKVHFTVANLNNKLHRMQEAPTTSAILGATFADPRYFAHHAALPQHGDLGDEGAANHNRFCREYDRQGVQFFVYGRRASGGIAPVKYPARQTLEASEAVARLHQLDPRYTVFAQQAPQAIDRGVFHNDVIAVSNRHVLFHHQQAFVDQAAVLTTLRAKSDSLDIPFTSVEVPDERERLLLHVLDGVQLAAWRHLSAGRSGPGRSVFYRKRLKGPIAALTEGAERIGRRDLDLCWMCMRRMSWEALRSL